MISWSEWAKFPDPRKQDYLYAPYGPGVYELRNSQTGEFVIFGRSKNLAHRMTSLLPKPYGCGNRKNENKRKYLLANIEVIEYRTIACASEADAKRIENQIKREKTYPFPT